jgi:Cell division septal protein
MNKRVGANKRKKKSDIIARVKAGHIVRRGFSFATAGLIACVVCAGGFVAAQRVWRWMGTSPVFTVRFIEVRGAQRITAQEIRRLSQLHEGMRIVDVKPVLAARAIMGNCWIRHAVISRRLPNKVVITVEERVPIALVSVGRVYYLDKEGVLLPLFPATYSDLPVLSGIDLASTDSVGKMIPKESLKRVLDFFAQAGRADLSLVKHLSQIDFAGESTVRLKIENSPMLIEIDDRQENVHLGRLKELMDILENSPGGMPRQINLCYSNLAFAQW